MGEIYTKFLNFVKLDIKAIPKIYITKTEPTADNYVFDKGVYYTWGNDKHTSESVNSIPLLVQKNILMKIISKILVNKGLKAEPRKAGRIIEDYFVYHEKDVFPHDSQDIFKVIKGFIYRIRVDNQSFYLVVDYKIKIIPTATYSYLLQKGAPNGVLINKYVLFFEDGKRMKGKVESIDSKVCKIKDLQGQEHVINSDDVYPEPKTYNLDIILRALRKPANAVSVQRKATFLDIKQASKRRIAEIKSILDNTMQKLFPIDYEGFKIDHQKELTPIFDVEWNQIKEDFDNKESLLSSEDKFFYGDSVNEEPQLLFDKEEASKFHLQPAYGLKLYGPFSKRDISKISVSIITTSTKKNDMQRLVQLINNGDGKYFLGMKKCFRADLQLNRTVELTDESIESYKVACEEYLQKVSSGCRDDLILVYVPEAFKDWVYSQYYLAKHILLDQGYSSQMLTDKTLKNPSYALLNIASAIYAKAGGIPWVLQKERREIDMILGLSYSQLIPEMASQRTDVEGLNRCIAFVNVFDQYGQWMFFQGNAYPYSSKNLPIALGDVIENAVARFEVEKGYKPKKIALHFSQKFSYKSKAAVIQALKGKIEEPLIAFISINDSHPFRAFDLATSDGSFSRRSYVYLDKGQYLLSTTGISGVTRQGIGTPKLLHIICQEYPHRFLEPKEIIEQVFSMTRLNWASANPLIREPITVSFSKEIAYLIATMSRGMWDKIRQPAILKNLEGRTWFI